MHPSLREINSLTGGIPRSFYRHGARADIPFYSGVCGSLEITVYHGNEHCTQRPCGFYRFDLSTFKHS